MYICFHKDHQNQVTAKNYYLMVILRIFKELLLSPYQSEITSKAKAKIEVMELLQYCINILRQASSSTTACIGGCMKNILPLNCGIIF